MNQHVSGSDSPLGRFMAEVLLLLFLWLPPAPASAQVAVVVEGADAAKIRQHIVKKAPSGVSVLDEKAFADALNKNGLSGELGVRISQASARGKFVEQVAAAGKAVNAVMVILARVVPNKAALWILAVDSRTGGATFDREIGLPEKERPKAKKGKKKSSGGGVDWSQVDAALDSIYANVSTGKTAAGGGADWGTPNWAGGSSGSKPSSSDAKPVESASKVEKRQRGGALEQAFLLVRPGYTISGRQFNYAGRQTDNLRPYEALGVSQVGIDVEAYPAAILQMAALGNLGLHVGYRQAIGLKSSPKDNKSVTLTTSWKELDVDLKYRLVFDPLMLSVSIGYGTLGFTFEVAGDDPLATQVPDLSYSFLRAGLDVRVNVGPVAVLAGGAYRLVFGTGSLGSTDYFPDNKAMGYDVNLGVALPLLPHFEVVVLGYYTGFGHTLNPQTDATHVATSASDGFYGLRLGAQLYF